MSSNNSPEKEDGDAEAEQEKDGTSSLVDIAAALEEDPEGFALYDSPHRIEREEMIGFYTQQTDSPAAAATDGQPAAATATGLSTEDALSPIHRSAEAPSAITAIHLAAASSSRGNVEELFAANEAEQPGAAANAANSQRTGQLKDPGSYERSDGRSKKRKSSGEYAPPVPALQDIAAQTVSLAMQLQQLKNHSGVPNEPVILPKPTYPAIVKAPPQYSNMEAPKKKRRLQDGGYKCGKCGKLKKDKDGKPCQE